MAAESSRRSNEGVSAVDRSLQVNVGNDRINTLRGRRVGAFAVGTPARAR